MQVHLICPFHRKWLIPTQINYLKPTGIIWHPVCDAFDMPAFDSIAEDWIHPFLCPPLKIPGDQAFKKLNDFIDAGNIIDSDYYGFMGDDDGYEPGFFDMVRQQTSKVLIFSLSRGNAIPPNALVKHGTSPLIISSKQEVRMGNIGLPQYILKGEVLRTMRFHNTTCNDDGYFAEELVSRFPDSITFLSDLFAFGNFFEPGRYTDNSFKLKSNWELPKFAVAPALPLADVLPSS